MNKELKLLLELERKLIQANDEDKASQLWYELWYIVHHALEREETIIEDGFVC